MGVNSFAKWGSQAITNTRYQSSWAPTWVKQCQVMLTINMDRVGLGRSYCRDPGVRHPYRVSRREQRIPKSRKHRRSGS